MFLSNSKDILFFVLSLAVLWLTIFSCWLLYYIISIFREIRGVLRDTRAKINAFEECFISFKNKIENSFSALTIISETLKQIVNYFLSKRKSKEEDDEIESDNESKDEEVKKVKIAKNKK